MRSDIITLIRGFVRIQVKGEQAEALLNRLLDERIFVWNITRLQSELEADIHLSDYFRLRPLLRETGCRTRVTRRFGLPFWLARLERRKFLVGGVFMFVIGLYMLSSLVWSVEIVGNDRVSTREVLDVAAEQGIHPLAWKFRLPDLDELSSRLMQNIPDAAWVGVEIRGTQVTIQIVENVIPEERELMNPRHLVSTSDAVITEIYAERGKPMVRRNMRVKKGDILISGIIGDEQVQNIVVAKGEVKGLVWYEYEINTPLQQTRKVYTGNEQNKFYIVLGNRALKITGYGQEKYERDVTLSEKHILRWRQWSIPIGWLSEQEKEVRLDTYEISEENAKQIGLAQARADIIARFGQEAKIHSEKILHEQLENGKVYMKVLFEVEHLISEEQPIVYTGDAQDQGRQDMRD